MSRARGRWLPLSAALLGCALAYTAAVRLAGVRPAWPALLLGAGSALLAWRGARPQPADDVRPEVSRTLRAIRRRGFVVLPRVSLGHVTFRWLVIGPPGVFALATVSNEEEAARQAEPLAQNAARLADRIGSVVEPVVAVVEGEGVAVLAGVPVVTLEHLEAWLSRRRFRWTAARVETVEETVREILGLGRIA